MADRFFPNIMPDFVTEAAAAATEDSSTGDSLMKLLSMPYPSLSQRFQRAGLDLKETIVMETWGLSGQSVQDFTLYSGTLGSAFLIFKSYQVTNNKNDLFLCLQIVKACDSASPASRDVTFLCGRAGVCALGAVAAKYANDQDLQNYYLNQFGEVKLSKNHPDELLYGRSGYLWACLFINKHIGEGTIPHTTIRAVTVEIIKNGRALAKKGGCPLMYEWYGERYWGAAHGLAGIMHVLMDAELKLDEVEDVKGTLKYMINNRFPSGNYPASEEDWKRDVLVHWCHGAPGIALTLVKAVQVFGDKEFLQAAVDAAEIVWNRGLLKRVGICHGISGNTYVFLALYRMTGSIEFLYRAKAFASFLLDRAHKLISAGEMHGGDSPYSLFEGIGGMAYLFLDMIDPSKARFPAYEL
ncbi:lanC-like protein GCL2 isoform X2 [Ricinus communis]|uniref:Catalytic, putative n=1 Tax=Ricinus communis TaxID=3988 RepID=B9RW22_RICCO|nr:lanC-like protein GCL2 isoform X2 [Ricinus communis]EEF44459.1 catalytic, putative [Ricinus communis]|eukprot:XP_002517941.1 lanC-like protein GCL2 isoform X2 [Ricinus communis]